MKNYLVESVTLENGEIIAYRQTGKKSKTLILIHGNMSSSVHFQTLMTELEAEFHVVAVDLSGFGDSTYRHPKKRLALYASEVAEVISKLQLNKVAVLGWSTGGGVALELAVQLPEKISQVYLLDSVGVKGFEMYQKDEGLQPILTQRLKTEEEIAADPVQVLPILKAYEKKDTEFIKLVWNSSIYLDKQPPLAEYELYLEAILKQRNLVDIDLALVHFNITNESNGVAPGSNHLAKIKCPVTIFHGEKDLIVPLAEAEATKKLLGEQAELIVFPQGGHSLVTDDLQGLGQKIRETYGKGAV